jgi:hypothetical protein
VNAPTTLAAPVLAAGSWPTNGDLIADVARLYYRGGEVCDPTYGRGLWWTKFQPETLIRSDIAAKGETVAPHDFTRLPHEPGRFSVVAFDPPYVCKGGRETSGIREMDDRYGLHAAPRTPEALSEMNALGLLECARVCADDGTIWHKTMDYVWSGKLVPQVFRTMHWANEMCGLELVDRFEHVGAPGPQPHSDKCRPCEGTGSDIGDSRVPCSTCAGAGSTPRRQIHARRNHSTLLVFRPKRRTSKQESLL